MLLVTQDLIWAVIGLALTIGGTWLEAHTTNFPWDWSQQGIVPQSLGVKYQIAAVLLTGCLGGKNAAALSQIAYLAIGLFWFPVFNEGGGLDYIQKQTFGYLLGFVPGAWICGYLAFKRRPRIEFLALSSLSGLFIIHLFGLVYLYLMNTLNWFPQKALPLAEAVSIYSIQPFPAHLVMVCAVTVVAYALRRLMFY
jgi:biotin transport system substrate-specific component